MKKIIMILFLLTFFTSSLALAASVGSPDISIPKESLFFKDEAVRRTLDQYEYNKDIRVTVEGEIVSNMDLEAKGGSSNAGVEGLNCIVKISSNFENVLEPYIKIGTSKFEANWNEDGYLVEVDTETGFVWGLGTKLKLAESQDYGVKLTLDAQYINLDLDVNETEIGKTLFIEPIRSQDTFEIKQWQVSLLASKRFILPLGIKDLYVVPYAGPAFTSTEVDISFDISGTNYSTGKADSDKQIGIIVGCDLMPSLTSWYLLNFEARFITESAFTIGGTIKF